MRSRGFTLIEVLVALAIVTIGMAAVMEALTSSARTAIYLQDKTFAEWVALNRMETVRLTGSVPAAGTSNDTLEYAGTNWEWQQKVTTTRIPGMVQIQVDVRPADSQAGDNRGWYATVTGFMSTALDPGTIPEQSLFQWSANPIDVLPQGGTAPNTTTPGASALTP